MSDCPKGALFYAQPSFAAFRELWLFAVKDGFEWRRASGIAQHGLWRSHLDATEWLKRHQGQYTVREVAPDDEIVRAAARALSPKLPRGPRYHRQRDPS